jgi:hypothetical protein
MCEKNRRRGTRQRPAHTVLYMADVPVNVPVSGPLVECVPAEMSRCTANVTVLYMERLAGNRRRGMLNFLNIARWRASSTVLYMERFSGAPVNAPDSSPLVERVREIDAAANANAMRQRFFIWRMSG